MRPAIVLAIIAVGAGVYLLTKHDTRAIVDGGQADLYLSPASATIKQAQEFTVTIRVNSGDKAINSLQANLSYPADALQFVATDNPCPAPAFGIIAQSLPKAGAPTPGSVKIACGSMQGTSGDQVIATVRFKAATNSGTARIDFTNSSLVLLKSDSSNTIRALKGTEITLKK